MTAGRGNGRYGSRRYVVAGDDLVAQDLTPADAHRVAFQTHQAARGQVEVLVMGHRNEQVFERFEQIQGDGK